jgi:hypothetical protein
MMKKNLNRWGQNRLIGTDSTNQSEDQWGQPIRPGFMGRRSLLGSPPWPFVNYLYPERIDWLAARKAASQPATCMADGKGTTRFAYDLQQRLIGEYSTAGVAQKEYVWLGDEVVAVLSYQ